MPLKARELDASSSTYEVEEIETEALQRFVGSYISSEGMNVKVTLEDRQVTYRVQ